MKRALQRKVFYSCSRECFKEPPFVSLKAGKDVSQSLAGWGRWRPRGIQRTSRATLCKQQQRFPHAQVPPRPASCTGPAIPASLHTLQGWSLQGSICSGCPENPALHLQQLCEEGLSQPPCSYTQQPRNFTSELLILHPEKLCCFPPFFFFFPTRHFPGSPLELGGEERRTAQLIPAASLPLPQPEKKSSPAPPGASRHPSILPAFPSWPPLCSGCSTLMAARV